VRLYDLAPTPPTPPSPVRMIDRRHTGLRKRENLLTGDGGGGESNPMTARKPGPVHII
jgi:hypothetical protein